MSKPPKKAEGRSLWVPIIDAVKSPLAFMVLALLGTLEIINVIGARMADQNVAFFASLGCVVLFVIAVVGLAIWNLETLTGVRPLAEHADRFAMQLYVGADGAFQSLQPAERAEAWATLGDVIASQTDRSDAYKDFCRMVSKRINDLAKITDRRIMTQGVIQEDAN
jgi:hypothetical protein